MTAADREAIFIVAGHFEGESIEQTIDVSLKIASAVAHGVGPLHEGRGEA